MLYYNYISDNRHSWNKRRVEELGQEIVERKEHIEEIDGFFPKLKERLAIRKLKKRQYIHGEEVLRYEYLNRNKRY